MERTACAKVNTCRPVPQSRSFRDFLVPNLSLTGDTILCICSILLKTKLATRKKSSSDKSRMSQTVKGPSINLDLIYPGLTLRKIHLHIHSAPLARTIYYLQRDLLGVY